MDDDLQRDEMMSDFYFAGYHEGFATGVVWAGCGLGGLFLLWLLLS